MKGKNRKQGENMKKIISVLLVLCMTVTLAGCMKSEDDANKVVEQKPLITVVIDEGGIGDNSFNDAVFAAAEDVAKEYDMEIRYEEAEDDDDYERAIREGVYQNSEIVIAAGSHMSDAVEKVAAENPENHFGIVDSYITADNIMSVSYGDNESAFLAGYAAGMTTETGKVGFIAGEKRDTTDMFRYGFEAGLLTANRDAQLVCDYTDTFLSEKKGMETAEKMIRDENVDVIFHVAGKSGIGVIEACQKAGIKAIGADMDQSSVAPDTVLCSTVKNMKDGIHSMVEAAVNEKYEGGYKIFRMGDGGVDFVFGKAEVSDKLKSQVENLKTQIMDEEIEIPDDEYTFAYYTTNYLN